MATPAQTLNTTQNVPAPNHTNPAAATEINPPATTPNGTPQGSQSVSLAWHGRLPRPTIAYIDQTRPRNFHRAAQRSTSALCVRAPHTEGAMIRTSYFSVGQQSRTYPAGYEAEREYIVLGIMNREAGSIPKEIKLKVEYVAGLFPQLRSGIKTLRPLWRRLLSLKTVSGFALYECHPADNSHSIPEVSSATERTLVALFWDFQTSDFDTEDHWMAWVRTELNGGQRKFALRLVLRWSAGRFVVWGTTPILLSLAIGFWYMYKPWDAGVDEVAVVQTAWTIASYIVTTAALAIGVLAAVTQVGGV
ncbi:hypothetical protein BJX64DRAFT_53619 [Aspergillus heterothallicus]